MIFGLPAWRIEAKVVAVKTASQTREPTKLFGERDSEDLTPASLTAPKSSMKTGRCLLTALFAVFVASTGASRAQIIVSNSLVSYSIQQSTNGIFIPASPLVSQTANSQLELNPVNFLAQASAGGISIVSAAGVLNVDMDTAAGQYFTGNAFTLDVKGSYNLVAPFSASEAFASLSGTWSLSLYEVDHAPFGAGSPMSGMLSFAPAATYSITGPVATSAGLWTNSPSFDINTIKMHFGVAPSSQLTGLRLQYSPSITAASSGGSATVPLNNVVLTNQVVPEPSTYALLLMSGAGMLWWMGRKPLAKGK